MELVTLENNQPVTSSLQVAEVFEKEHKHVMDSIRDLIKDITKAEKSALGQNVDTSMFYEDTYQVEGNFKKYPMFYMNKDGWTLLVMGYRGKKATQFKLQYINQFNAMEEQIKQQAQLALPQDYPTALEQLAQQIRLNESLQNENKQLKNGVSEQTELSLDVLYTTEDLARELGYSSARTLNQELKKQRIIYHQKGLWHLYAPYKNRGFKDMSTLRKSQYWTEKGREFVTVRCAKNEEV